ncbi:hypothetical protein DACRYDRAFT_102914 [Dacryopinax primogenitus]|uniref:Uncharacterized protein n=1 Tax=Dacryopinax primogenitus (strain DJM 731) TaxID=1858805 RepID=M5GAQ5_DACPD|nr:uncharacterized protein DACRYDRAFT_102914 [Dacryopinax primogenitus]EJU05954.1 hypothetical protein DACRYDRAFT_102914 [Dacryopinax primogenitus]
MFRNWLSLVRRIALPPSLIRRRDDLQFSRVTSSFRSSGRLDFIWYGRSKKESLAVIVYLDGENYEATSGALEVLLESVSSRSSPSKHQFEIKTQSYALSFQFTMRREIECHPGKGARYIIHLLPFVTTIETPVGPEIPKVDSITLFSL